MNVAVAYSYIRMSSGQQIKGDSLRRQLEMSRAWADANGITLDESLRDIGVSAWKGKNRREGALGRFLEMVERGQIRRGSHLLVESLDRLSRDQVLEALSLFLEIIRSGITIVTLADSQTYSQESVGDDWSKLIISLTIMARAHEESQRKSERVNQSYVARRAQAAEEGRRMTVLTPTWITAEKHGRGKYTYTLNEKADIVRRLFELTADGMGQMMIAQRFNEEGVATLGKGVGWYNSSVGRVLNSRAAIGEFQPQKREGSKFVPAGDPIKDYFPAAVTFELFQRAQARRYKRGFKSVTKGTQFANLFSGLCKCAACQNTMVMITNGAGRKPIRYLRCITRMRKGDCENAVTFRYEWLENGILDNVREFHFADVLRAQRGDDPLKRINEEIAATTVEISGLEKRIANLLNELELVESPEERTLAREQFRARVAQSNAAKERLADQQHERDKIEIELGAGSRVEEEIAETRSQWDRVEQPERYLMRTRVNTALTDFIDFISFDGHSRLVTVVLLGGVRAYRFLDGKMVVSVNLVPQLGSREEGKIDPQVLTADGVTAEPRPSRKSALDKLRSSAE